MHWKLDYNTGPTYHHTYTWGTKDHLDVTLTVLKNYMTHTHFQSYTRDVTLHFTVLKNYGLLKCPMDSYTAEDIQDSLQDFTFCRENSTDCLI